MFSIFEKFKHPSCSCFFELEGLLSFLLKRLSKTVFIHDFRLFLVTQWAVSRDFKFANFFCIFLSFVIPAGFYMGFANTTLIFCSATLTPLSALRLSSFTELGSFNAPVKPRHEARGGACAADCWDLASCSLSSSASSFGQVSPGVLAYL